MNEATNEKEPSVDLRIQDLLLAYLRRWKLIVLCMLVAGSLAWGLTYFFVTPMYRTSIKIYVSNNRATEDKDYLSNADVSASIYLVKGYLIVSETDAILEKAVEKLNGDYTPSQLRKAITVEQITNTVIYNLYVTHSDPVEAARIATVMGEVIPVEGPRIIDGTSARTIDSANVPSSPYTPDYNNNITLGLVAGFVLAVVYITILFLKDTHIKDENDLTDMFDLPILGRIPDFDDVITGNKNRYDEKGETTDENE